MLFGGKGWIRTIEDWVDGFTVRCIWPLCNLPKNKMELVIGIEPTTCWLQVSCSTVEPHQHSVLNWRPGRDSNPRPPAWQAGILTSWTTRPHIYVNGGTNRARTCDPLLVRQVLSQLSYSPGKWWPIGESNPCYRRERAVSWPLDQRAVGSGSWTWTHDLSGMNRLL